MKNILLIITFFFTFFDNSIAQPNDTLRINIKKNKIEISDSIAKLPVVILLFDEVKNRDIELIADKYKNSFRLKCYPSDTICIDKESNLVSDSINLNFNDKLTIKLSDKDSKEIQLQSNNGNIQTATPTSDGNQIRRSSIYYDALLLADSSLSPKDRKNILLTYYTKEDITNNEYLKDIEIGGETRDGNSSYSSFLSFFTTNVTYFATSVSRFIADQAKAELNEMFFNNMKEKVNEDAVLKTVFPQTAITLDHIENYGQPYVLQVLRNAFETDMLNLDYNLYMFKDIPEYEPFFKDSIEGKWLSLGLSTVDIAKTITNPANLLDSLTKTADFIALKDTLCNASNPELNVLSFLELNNLISQSLLSREKDQVWIKPEQLDTLLDDPKVFKIYIGLLLAKEQNKDSTEKIYFIDNKKDTISFESILVNSCHADCNPEKFKRMVQNAYSVYKIGNNAVKELVKNKQDTVTSRQALYEFYRTAINATRPVAYGIANVEIPLDISKLSRIEKLLNPAVDFVYHVAVKQYTPAVFDASILFNSLNTTKKSLMKYGTFISSVANAQSEEEVKRIIKESTLPVASLGVKRNSNFSIMINAYIGGYYGYSCQKRLANRDTLKTLHSLGLYMPVGFSLNQKKGNSVLSLTANILDFGSLASIYLKDGNITSYDFEVHLIDIISPGLQLSYLFPKSPFTVFTGVNYIPKLYPVEDSYKGGWSWRAGIAMDIPLYNLYTCD